MYTNCIRVHEGKKKTPKEKNCSVANKQKPNCSPLDRWKQNMGWFEGVKPHEVFCVHVVLVVIHFDFVSLPMPYASYVLLTCLVVEALGYAIFTK